MKLAIEQLETRRGRFVAGPVDIHLASGDCLALMGANGAGKTTLLETFAGFFAPVAGRMLLDDEDVTSRVPERRHFAYLPQDMALFPHLDVAQNIAYGSKSRRARGDQHAITSLLDEFGLGPLRRLFPHQLSRGQAQRVALARALATEPIVLLLDEPAASLDLSGQRSFMAHMRKLRAERKLIVIYATHNVLDSLSLATHLIVLRDGKVAQAGTPEGLFRTPANAYVAELLGITNLWPIEQVTHASATMVVRAGGCELACTRGDGADNPGFIAIGPGEIELSTSPPPDRVNCFEAAVQTLQLSGLTALVELGCSLRGLHATLPPGRADGITIGQKLWVRLPPDRLRLIGAATRH